MTTDEEAQEQRKEERQHEAQPGSGELRDQIARPGHGVGEGELQGSPLPLPADGVIGEEDGEQRQDHLDDEGQVQEPEDRQYRIVGVDALTELRLGHGAHRGEPADIVVDAAGEDLQGIRLPEGAVGEAEPRGRLGLLLAQELLRRRLRPAEGVVLPDPDADAEQDEDRGHGEDPQETRAQQDRLELLLDEGLQHGDLTSRRSA
jgi:hypothetical protein